MAIFYDWRDRTEKGWKPWREEIKELRSPLFVEIGILLLFLMALLVWVYFGYLRPYYRNLPTKSERVYLLPDPPKQTAVMPENGTASHIMSAIKADNGLNLNSTRERLGATPFDEAASSESISFANEGKTYDSATLEAEDAETGKLLKDGVMIQKQAIETMNQATPKIVNHLNTLSIEEQEAFLKQIKDQMVSLTPPEVQKLYAQDPDFIDKGYELFLEKLRENGWGYYSESEK